MIRMFLKSIGHQLKTTLTNYGYRRLIPISSCSTRKPHTSKPLTQNTPESNTNDSVSTSQRAEEPPDDSIKAHSDLSPRIRKHYTKRLTGRKLESGYA